jgi:NAD(P)H-dependent FMN reductase
MTHAPPHLVLLNGSLRGADGNTGWLLREAARRLAPQATVDLIDLAGPLPDLPTLEARLLAAEGFLVGTGVYWHSWGSPLQRFLEVLTPQENTPVFLGKPVGALVTMDSVGGSELAARLLGVFSSLGCLVPPCSALILSRVGMEAGAVRPLVEDDPNEDVWQLQDLDVVLHNVIEGTARGQRRWRPWKVRALQAQTGAYPASGVVELGSPRFLPQRG